MKNKRMKIARVEHDLSQEQLGERVGVTRQTISMIESGTARPALFTPNPSAPGELKASVAGEL